MLRYHVKVLLETKLCGNIFQTVIYCETNTTFSIVSSTSDSLKNVIDLEYIRTVSSVARLKRTQCLLFSPRCGLYSERLQSTGELSGLLASCRIGSKAGRVLLFRRPVDDLHLGRHDLCSYWPYQYKWAGRHRDPVHVHWNILRQVHFDIDFCAFCIYVNFPQNSFLS